MNVEHSPVRLTSVANQSERFADASIHRAVGGLDAIASNPQLTDYRNR